MLTVDEIDTLIFKHEGLIPIEKPEPEVELKLKTKTKAKPKKKTTRKKKSVVKTETTNAGTQYTLNDIKEGLMLSEEFLARFRHIQNRIEHFEGNVEKQQMYLNTRDRMLKRKIY